MFNFGNKKQERVEPSTARATPPHLLVLTAEPQFHGTDNLAPLQERLASGRSMEAVSVAAVTASLVAESEYVLSLFNEPTQLDAVADHILAARAAGRGTVLIIAIKGAQLVALGRWIERRAAENRLGGVRLMLAYDLQSVADQLTARMIPVVENNVIRMPITTEVENSPYKTFYVFSPPLQALVARIRAFSENGIARAYLLGGPGSGKTSLAYYYFLVRNRGRFVSVNLAAENSGDKSAVKSLLCGHVAGAFPGAGARIGAFTQAREGVCFIDESHGVAGAVMEVLMEALDNGQYLPFGASAKQKLDCALLFATNRSWEHLQNSVNIDEFTRLGAAVLQVPELMHREEDLIAVVATTLARLAERCTTWTAPQGLSREGWEHMQQCRWHGNIRAVIRVLEAAFVDTAIAGHDALIQTAEIERGIQLWEPKKHHSHQIYGTH